METEPDDRFYETSYSHDGIYDQFLLFIMDASGIEYPPQEKPISSLHENGFYSPEVAWPGW